jgi:gliding motility-associated-like protein
MLDTTNSAINCAGDSTGVIVAVAQGGLGNYDYALQDENGNDLAIGVETSPGVFTELPAGDYIVVVTSEDCDVSSLPVSIQEPSNPLLATIDIANVTCNGSNNGVITVETTGGSGVIKYAISPQLDQFFDDPVFENLAPGDYQIIVQDELGCFELIDASVTEPAPVLLSIVPNSIFPEVCSGDANGEFSIAISGGTLPYSVSLDNPDGPYTTGSATQTEFDFTNLSGGDHIVYISDSAGCTSEWNITFPPSVSINPLMDIVYNCDTSNTVGNTVTVSLDDETIDPADLDYSLNGGPYQTSPVFTNISPGRDQYIEVRHSNGCIQSTDTFTIEEVPVLDLVLQEGELNEIIANAAGGSEIYEYFLNGESYGSTNTFIVYESGVYTVSVRDSYGCEVSATITIEYIDVCIPNYFTPNNDGVLDVWGPGCASQYQNLTFDIFDRYGRKVASLNVDEKWDGTYDGRELPTGDYWYVVRLNDTNDDRDFVGHFTLYR